MNNNLNLVIGAFGEIVWFTLVMLIVITLL